MIARAESLNQVHIFTQENYAQFTDPDAGVQCRSWTKERFIRWLTQGLYTMILNDDREPMVFPEKDHPDAIAEGCYWFKVRSMVGGVSLYAMAAWPLAAEIGRTIGVELTDPRE